MAAPRTINSDDTDYVLGYFRELSPSFLSLCALQAGYRFEQERAPRYLELGFGQGVSLNIHAAANAGDYMGNDFAPNHLAFAQSMARASGASLKVVGDSFQQLAESEDLPTFDIIALHGIWTWVAEPDRAAIVRIVERSLAPGGLLYVSHNCAFAWSALGPVRKLIHAHVKADASSRPLTEKVLDAFDFVQKLIEQDARHFKVNPGVVAHIEKLRKRDPDYLVHEFFSHNSEPTSIADLAERFAPIDVDFIAYGYLIENLTGFSKNEAGHAFMSSIEDKILRETAREAFLDAYFRKDIFMKSPTRLTEREQSEALAKRRFVLSARPDAVSLKVGGPNGVVPLDPTYFGALLNALAANNYAPKTAAELASLVGGSARDIADHLCLLCAATWPHVHPAPAEVSSESVDRCKKLNKFILDRTAAGTPMPALACASSGNGLRMKTDEQLLLRSILNGARSADAAADDALAQFKLRGAAPRREDLIQTAQRVQSSTLPIMQALGVV